MMSGKRKAREAREVGRGGSSLTTTTRTTGSGPRKSLSDRLAHMSALAGIRVSIYCLAGVFTNN